MKEMKKMRNKTEIEKTGKGAGGMKKVLTVALALGMAMMIGAPAQAAVSDTIWVNDSALGWIEVATFDWSPGNALADNAVPLNTVPPADPSDTSTWSSFDLYFQASLGNFEDINSDVVNNTGLNVDYEITMVAGAGELGVSQAFGNSQIASFEFDPASTVNFVEIYYDTNMNHSDLAGTGFDDGTLIMTAVVVEADGIFSVSVLPGDVEDLDNFNANDYPGIGTLTGQGGSTIGAEVDWVDTAYIWPDPTSVLTLFFETDFNTSQVVPFNETDPSALVAGIAPVFGDNLFGLPGLTNINGLPGQAGPVDFLFQADANQSFTSEVIPEPSTFLLTGLGLLGLGGLGLRRRNRS